MNIFVMDIAKKTGKQLLNLTKNIMEVCFCTPETKMVQPLTVACAKGSLETQNRIVIERDKKQKNNTMIDQKLSNPYLCRVSGAEASKNGKRVQCHKIEEIVQNLEKLLQYLGNKLFFFIYFAQVLYVSYLTIQQGML